MADKKSPIKRTSSSSRQAPKRLPDLVLSEIVLSVIESCFMDDRASYVSRGRKFDDQGAEELQQQWVDAFRRMVESFREDTRTFSEEARLLHTDLQAELKLRGLDPHFERVAPEIEKFREIIRDECEKLQETPAGHSKIIEEYLKRSCGGSN